MNFFRDVLKRAEKEGKIDPRMIPGERRTVLVETGAKRKIREEPGPSIEPLEFPDEALNDFQLVIENLCSIASKKNLRVIGIASSVQNQGNSTLAALFSLMMARRENGYYDPKAAPGIIELEPGRLSEVKRRQVLLIDTNMRCPSLHRIFHVDNDAGLGELLHNEVTVQDVVKEVESSHLRLIPAGRRSTFRFAQIHFERFQSILEKSRRENEFVFLDLPPILHYAEGITLSNLCDGVILVVCAEQTRIETILETKRLLEDVNVPVVGSVLNRRKFYIPEWMSKRL